MRGTECRKRFEKSTLLRALTFYTLLVYKLILSKTQSNVCVFRCNHLNSWENGGGISASCGKRTKHPIYLHGVGSFDLICPVPSIFQHSHFKYPFSPTFCIDTERNLGVSHKCKIHNCVHVAEPLVSNTFFVLRIPCSWLIHVCSQFPSVKLARQLATRIGTTFSGESIFCSNIDFAIVRGVASESCSRRRCSFKKRVLASDKSSAVGWRTDNRSILGTGGKENGIGG